MYTLKHKLEYFFFIAMAAVLGLFLAFSVNKNVSLFKTRATMPVRETNNIPTPIPTGIPVLKESVISQISSDATKKVVLHAIQNSNNSQTATLSTEDGGGQNEKIIFTKILSKDENILIPYNTWSPDDKYFFIQENTSSATAIMVFQAKGEPFANGASSLDLTGLFRKQNMENSFKEATGWASESLIIVNTTTQNNTRGPSYWFEVPSKAIIQLSTPF